MRVSNNALPAEMSAPVVTFHLADQRYALPLDAVLQVVRMPGLTHIAGSPAAVCGLLNLRGRFLPVLDGRVLVGTAPSSSLDSCVLILAHDGRPALGLLADEAEAVRTFSHDDLTVLPHSAAFIAGVLRGTSGPTILLDPAALQAVAGTS